MPYTGLHPTDPAAGSIPLPVAPSLPVVLPSEASATMIDAGERVFARGLKLASLKNDVLLTMCTRRGIALTRPKKKDMVAALEQWVSFIFSIPFPSFHGL